MHPREPEHTVKGSLAAAGPRRALALQMTGRQSRLPCLTPGERGLQCAMALATHALPPCAARPALARPAPARWGCSQPACAPLELRQGGCAAQRRGPARLAAAAVDMETLEQAAVAEEAEEGDDDMVIYSQPDKPRVKKRSRRFRAMEGKVPGRRARAGPAGCTTGLNWRSGF